MEYIPLDSFPYYKECSALVEGLGYKLVELHVSPQKTTIKINAVIASCDPHVDIGVSDCAKVHHALLPRLEALLKTYPKELEERFSVQVENKTPLEIMEEIAERRKYVVRGGEIDYERTAKAILDDFRKGRIGKITL